MRASWNCALPRIGPLSVRSQPSRRSARIPRVITLPMCRSGECLLGRIAVANRPLRPPGA